MKNDNNGFTLIEVLVTVTLLGIVTLVALPIVSAFSDTINNSKYDAYNKSIESAAKLYTDSYSIDMFGYYPNGCYKISYSLLKNKDLVKDINDKKSNCSDDSGTYVYVIKLGDNYLYQSSLVCKDSSGRVLYSNSSITNPACGLDENSYPLIVLNPNSSSPVKNINVDVKLDGRYGYGLNQKVRYEWLDASKNPIGKNGDINYKNDPQPDETPLLSKTISSPTGLTGTYYLKITPVNVSNYIEQEFNTNEYISGKYVFDNIPPTVVATNDVSISTNNLKIKLNDNIRLAYYAITTSATPPGDSDSSWVSTGNVTEFNKTLSKTAATYYIHCRDAANNKTSKKIVVKIDNPTAPVITGGIDYWSNSNRIIWTKTLSTSLSGISKYQYCIAESNNTSKCGWNDLENNNDGVTASELADVAFYHSNYSDLIDAFKGNVNQLNNHYISHGKSEGRATSDASWVRTSQNFSNEGIHYVFFRAITKTTPTASKALESPASNSARIKIDTTKPIVNISASKNSNSITVVANASDAHSGVKTYYYKIDGGGYVSDTKNSHKFTGLNYNSTHTVRVYVVDNAGNKSEEKYLTVTTDSIKFGQYLRLAKTQGFNNNVLGNMYRYTGKYVNNYVCIGTLNMTECLNNRPAFMYRVIGVVSNPDDSMKTKIDMVKVIKENYTAFQPWGPYNEPTYWSNSQTRTYVNNFPVYGGYDGLIADINWRHGTGARHDWDAQTFFNNETGWGWLSTSKKALMYASDYLFATGNPNQVCTDNANAIACTNTWIYLGGGDGNKQHFEYTMDYSANSVISSYAAIIIRNWNIENDKIGALWPEGTNEARRVRPVFYLKTDTYYAGGSGTSDNPFLIK